MLPKTDVCVSPDKFLSLNCSHCVGVPCQTRNGHTANILILNILSCLIYHRNLVVICTADGRIQPMIFSMYLVLPFPDSRFIVKPIHFVNSVCTIFIFEKGILLAKPFQASQSWHQLSFYENKILVQSCLKKWMDFNINFKYEKLKRKFKKPSWNSISVPMLCEAMKWWQKQRASWSTQVCSNICSWQDIYYYC